MNRRLLFALLAVVVIGAGYFVYELIDTDAPDEVSTEAALEQLTEEAAAESTEASDAEAEDPAETSASDDEATDSAAVEPAGASNVEATWTVDDEFGEFGFDNASGSFAGFRVEKAFFSGQGATAVGRSGSVSGEFVIGSGELTSASIVVDMTAMESDEAARVSAINSAVKTGEHPTATFVVDTPVSLDTDALAAGETVAVTVEGQLTIAGVTNSVAVPIEATVVEDGFGLVVGSTELVWADYGVETPSSSVADVADDGILEFQLIVRT